MVRGTIKEIFYFHLFLMNRSDIKDGVTLHLVIRAPKPDSAAAAPSSTSTTNESQGSTPHAAGAAPTASPAGFPFGLGMPPGLGNLNFANANFLDMQQQLQQQVIRRDRPSVFPPKGIFP